MKGSGRDRLAKPTMAMMVAVEDFDVYSIGGVTTANEVITSCSGDHQRCNHGQRLLVNTLYVS